MSGVLGGLLGSLAVPLEAFRLISSTTLTSNANSLTLSSIPTDGSFTHLMVRIGTIGGNSQALWARINGSSGTNYASAWTGSLTGSTSGISEWRAVGGNSFDAQNTSFWKSHFIMEIPFYNNTSHHKGFVSRGFSYMAGQRWGLWNGGRNSSITSAISSITFLPGSTPFTTGTTIELYGFSEG